MSIEVISLLLLLGILAFLVLGAPLGFATGVLGAAVVYIKFGEPGLGIGNAPDSATFALTMAFDIGAAFYFLWLRFTSVPLSPKIYTIPRIIWLRRVPEAALRLLPRLWRYIMCGDVRHYRHKRQR